MDYMIFWTEIFRMFQKLGFCYFCTQLWFLLGVTVNDTLCLYVLVLLISLCCSISNAAKFKGPC